LGHRTSFSSTVGKHWSRVLAVGVLVLLLTSGDLLLQAQQGNAASLGGTVLDPQGNVIQSVSVTVINEANGEVRKLTADAQGHFSVAGLLPGTYTVNLSAPGFAITTHPGVRLAARENSQLSLKLGVGNVSQQVTVSAGDSDSIASQLSPVQALLDARSARSEISPEFIQKFTSPVTDYAEIIQIVPGTFTINTNGVGLGQATTSFRGFQDGEYDITWDGIPFQDTNTPSHHSWAFFPGPWVGGVDFDRSPGSASTVGVTPFGGSVNLLSKDVPSQHAVRGAVSYGSFNTLLLDGEYDSGLIGSNHKTSLSLDVHRLTSDGFETFNYQTRTAGEIKVQYQFSDKTILTGFSGVIRLDANTPDANLPTRAQVAQFGYNYLLNNTPGDPSNFHYNLNHVPTDFEYVGIKSQRGHGWVVDIKPYTYSYYNLQNFTNVGSVTTITDAPTSATPNGFCATQVKGKLPCGIDKLNSYRQYGETSMVSQTSKFGVFRAGMWYNWSTTNRFQFPSDPLTGIDQVLPNFHERYYTNIYQPFAEYEYHATRRLTMTGGLKFAYYNQSFTQFADDGKVVGNLGGLPFITNTAGYKSYLPSADANYRLTTNWSIYGQFSKGSIIPPTTVFDQQNGSVANLPKPTGVSTYQAGTVLKLNRLSFDGDAYFIKFQNPYSSFTPTNGDDTIYFLGPDSISKGIELETNAYLGHGLSLYGNGTVGSATYTGAGVPSGLWVTNTPANTEGFGLTYQRKNVDLGMFDKRIGPQWNDNGSYHNQIYTGSFSTVNLFLNYSIKNGSRFNGSKLELSFNNLLNAHDVVGVIPAGNPVAATLADGTASPYIATTAINGGDQLTQTPGRSVMVTFIFGSTGKR
jgi:iron complex outermembrane recepter protein